MTTTDRFIVSFPPGGAAIPGVLRDLAQLAGVRTSNIALAADSPSAGDADAGLFSAELGLGVVRLPPDARAAIVAAGRMRIRPERVFSLPRPFQPRAVGTPPPNARRELGLAGDDADLDLPDKSWALETIHLSDSPATGKGVRVAVLDSGIWAKHPDFAKRKITSKSFVANVPDARDDLGHGTFCAGIIAGPAKPKSGPRYGVAPDVELYVGRVMNEHGNAREGDIIHALDWALANDCRIVSMSLGAPPGNLPDADYDEAAERALNHKCLIIAAAGNDSAGDHHRMPVRIPASSNGVLAVAAVTPGLRSTFDSNAGVHPDNGGAVDLAAPGVQIYSAGTAESGGDYVVADGTSAAAPFVAGLAAHYLELEPKLTAWMLWKRLQDNASAPPQRDRAGLAQSDIGFGIVRAPMKK